MTNRAEALIELGLIEAKMLHPLSEEQREFAHDFTRDIITFANPGTGKTHTLTAGILLAQQYYKIDPRKIFCMSFTRAATYEIMGRYKVLAKKLRASTDAEFGTFHSLANKILASAYQHMEVVESYDTNTAIEDMSKYIQKLMPEYPFDKKKVYQIMKVIDELNAAFIFDDDNISRKYSFRRLNMPVADFNKLRRQWFNRGIISNQISQGDIPIYCLYALLQKPEVASIWNGKYDIMIVDEFQDLSLLDLEILNRVATRLIVVGDMKQQIYAFSGACPEIVDAYKKARPDAVTCNLTQSFRCPQEVADLANKIIKPNLNAEADFKGRDYLNQESDCISIKDRTEINWSEVFKDTNSTNLNDILILYRNNASTIPILDELFERKIPFRCPKFVRVTEIPVLKTICTLVTSAWKSTDPDLAQAAIEILPEFRFQKYNARKIANVMRNSTKNIWELDSLMEQQSSKDIFNFMHTANQKILDGKSAGTVIASMLPIYDKYFAQYEFFPNEQRYYLNMAAGICNRMTYPEVVAREQAKYNWHLNGISSNMGVRCYTMHSSKGLEGNIVYLLDVNEGLFPNATQLEKKTQVGCLYDAALDIRSERNLLYVAVTRAKKQLVISYSDNKLANLISTPDMNMYQKYDEVYRTEYRLHDDIGAFSNLMISKGSSSDVPESTLQKALADMKGEINE